jgi:hypothetical protein
VTDIGRNIHAFLHCRECVNEWNAGEAPGNSPSTYARLSVGWTQLGLQVVCNRHDLNVAHIDFEGAQHPADQSKEGDFGGTYWARVEARQKAAK